MAIQIGQAAPDFTLYNTDRQQITLSSLRGKNVLLLFFPFAFTGTCTKELCATRDNLTVYQGLNAEVFGISVDNVDALKRFKEDLNLNFALLSDFNKDASAAYDSIYETFSLGRKGVSKRSAFVIDKEGMVRYAEVLENASEIPDFNKIQQSLKEINR